MSKAEQAAKDYAKNLGCEEGVWLWKLMADFATSQPFNQQIEQLTQERDFWKIGSFDDKIKAVEKERDELTFKMDMQDESRISVIDMLSTKFHDCRECNKDLQQQLSAEKQKNEKLEIIISKCKTHILEHTFYNITKDLNK